MNTHERNAWCTLLYLGARKTEIGGKAALDMSDVRIRSAKNLRLFCRALVEVAGRSGKNRRHTDRYGSPIYVVTDDLDPTGRGRSS